MSDPEGRRSVARAFTMKIGRNPFNGVKLDLAIVILICLAVFLLLAGLQTSRQMDSLILMVVAGVGAVWVVWRTRRVLRQQQSEPPEDEDGAQ
jgi:threonine/homoserine/homoserine lactone efflux protein